MFPSNVFWSAFARAGMLVEAVFRPVSGPAVPFQAGYERPDQVVLDGVVHTTSHRIEYQRTDVELSRGAMVDLKLESGTERFRVFQTPAAKGDGTYMCALLEKASP